ncbi:hypothetical protein PV08_05704 [Exophiala spinifera]|uniref:Uncharacterized protein n=1 Tax=Exophiala spinifera TaxID=91928 RepID=A0A0D2BAN8_9EURO|nr:uncharacterized protein PV08_05704 [Exophiala spinifera]KIW15655.1 hypothetical protein PV08_05704 [Exophiala spinifera]
MSIRPWTVSEQAQYSPSTVAFPPPPPRPRDGQSAASPVRPSSLAIPSPLTINATSRPIFTQTPISATSLHGPFSPTYVSSPGPSPRTVLPMAGRASASSHYNVPYDPREWVEGSRRSSMIMDARPAEGQPEDPDGISSPPPPYTAPPARDAVATSASSTVSPADSTFTGGNQSRTHTPASTVGVVSPFTQPAYSLDDGGGGHSNIPKVTQHSNSTARTTGIDSRIARISMGLDHADIRSSPAFVAARPASIASLSINTAAAQQTFLPSVLQDGGNAPGAFPPASRRAASADASSSHTSSSKGYGSSTSRSSSKQRSWQPGMPLPGPPPGPPPPNTRSLSANGVRIMSQGQVSGPNSRFHHRAPVHAPVLSPMPPTPANWTEDSTSRSNSRAPMALHIETSNLDRSSINAAGLSRSAAMRVSSARGLLERRKNRRSLYEGSQGGFSALTIETDPWLDGRSPGGISADHSPTLDSLLSGPSTPATDRRGSRATSRAGSRTRTSRPLTPLYPPRTLPTPPPSHRNPTSAHSALPSNASSVCEVVPGDPEEFVKEASRRHEEFLLRESQANTDLERLQLFMDFVVAESRIRRQRYPSAFVDGKFDTSTLNKRMFQEAAVEGVPVEKEHAFVSGQNPEATWWKDYRPALSPIASMSNDEVSSRGRTASRWWQSQSGSEVEGGPKKMKRSKRESKYMGLPALSVQEVLSEADTPTNFDELYSSEDVYPAEKADPESFGIYGSDVNDATFDKTSENESEYTAMDISRFITLPPPYPRHHPAVNNSHPRLVAYRKAVRNLSDLSEIQRRRGRHDLSVEALRAEHQRKLSEGRQTFKANIQQQIEEGSITYADAAEAERALRLEEHAAEKACLQAEFDTLQDVVINPMHDMLNERVGQLTNNVNDLVENLVAEMHTSNLDRAQQEGDATPEILEYLTQLKWLFETREAIHKEIFDLLSMRNDKYKAMVLLPYHQAGNLEKIRDTEDFFTRDSLARRKSFCDESLERYRTFVQLVAKNVGQEVELQSSSFWDIAPSLLDMVQKIPDDLYHLGPIAIPDSEYIENPTYHEYPQQYLYTLLDHAEKSTYQFIESQINLHCLLHEVNGALIGAEYRAAEAARACEQVVAQPVTKADDGRLAKAEREASATAELKQQVSMIEEQWLEALGSALQGKKKLVHVFLESIGGWDESMQEDG